MRWHREADYSDHVTDEGDFAAMMEILHQERLNHPGGWVHPNLRPSRTRRSTVHQMKITLNGVKPRIWRRVVMPSTYRLDEVAEALLEAMGWANSHLHAFFVGELRYDMVGPYSEGDELDERGFTLREVFDEVGRTMRFEYDFGDGWEHTVLLEAVRLQTKAEGEPYCVAGKSACPPDDCGGPHGYMELLEIRENGTKTDWDRERLEWLGEFDPTAFDPEEATAAMRSPLRLWE